jgi:hypothetical protein
MPASVARSHFWETLGFSLVFGALAGWLLCRTAPHRKSNRPNSQIGGFKAVNVAYHSIASDLLEMTDLLYGPETTFCKLRFQRSSDLDHKR